MNKPLIPEKKTVLLIDDDHDEYELISETLKRYNMNIECHHTTSCAEAMEFVNKRLPNWIFLDVNLPRINGFECLRQLKDSFTGMNVPIYFFSTSTPHDVQEQVTLIGAADWIQKPRNAAEYLRVYEEILK